MLVNGNNDASQAYPQIQHAGTRMLFRYWEKMRGENAAPRRDDLDLRQISAIVPNLILLDRDNLRQTYKWRLSGSETSQLYRRPLTNTDALTGWSSFERETLKQHFDAVVTNLQPCLIRYHLTTDTEQVISAELLGLPMQARNGMRFHIFGGVFPLRDALAMSYDRIVHLELSGIRTIWTEPLPGDTLLANALVQPGGLRVIRGGLA
jgi:hypothetical protein